MGVDCMLFAVKAKKCVWLDRHYNVGRVPSGRHNLGVWWLGFLEGLERADDDHADNYGTKEANRKHATAFILRHGIADEYFVITDHHEPSCFDFAEANGFTQEKD